WHVNGHAQAKSRSTMPRAYLRDNRSSGRGRLQVARGLVGSACRRSAGGGGRGGDSPEHQVSDVTAVRPGAPLELRLRTTGRSRGPPVVGDRRVLQQWLATADVAHLGGVVRPVGGQVQDATRSK